MQKESGATRTIENDHFFHLLDAIPSSIAYVDSSLEYRYVNQFYQELIGKTSYDIVGKKIFEVVKSEYFLSIKKHIDAVLSGQSVHFEYHLPVGEGMRYFDVTYTPNIKRNKGTEGFTIHINDITRQRISELDVQDYIENAPIALHWVNADGIIIWANRVEMEMLGYEKEEYIGHHISEFHVDQDSISTMLLRLGRNEILNEHEAVLRAKDGTFRNVLISSSVLWQNGKFIRTRCFTMDVTELKRIEQTNQLVLEREIEKRTSDLARKNRELQKSEERFHRMVNEVQDYAIILLNHEGIIENWNAGAEKIKGYTMAEALGRSFKMFYNEVDRESGLPDMLLKLAEKNGRADHEGWRVRKDGTLFWGSVVLTALHGDGGEIIGFSKVTRDLTERKAAEDAVRNNAAQLREKNRELEKMNQELASFAYVSSHDLQEPLRKIQTFSSRILDLEQGNFGEKSKDYFNRIQRSAHRMRVLIEDLLSYSRANTTDKKFVSLDLNRLINGVIDELKESIECKNAFITCDQLPTLNVIPFQFQQLLLNIFSNALKFSKNSVRPEIRVSYQLTVADRMEKDGADSTFHVIRISDNGIGFDPKFNSQVFEIFQRLHNRTEYEGTGVGLAICKKIVENHNGFITAEGKLNEGVTFNIYLPA